MIPPTLLMLITFERKVPERSVAAQNDHKSKSYLARQKSDEVGLSRLGHLHAVGSLPNGQNLPPLALQGFPK